ncbi:hypothetical protein BDN72DRAFT_277948 [Pluteus cervinus]|uniref:Uncharacterized protein n=1 Tax=Pluteus cervinus TaxID=181527 RepID=A0ACD3AEB9_9AGAR|nr:hypothetical protein BDN72DRAFT_277948 [Pluteus cervinus]
MRHPPPPTPSTPVPRLPPELECLIFQLAAHARKWGIPKLMLVARRVHIWTEPILYSTFLAFHPHSRDRHHQGRHHQPPVSQLPRYGKHIRHLVIGSDAQVDEGINYLRHCLNVRELVILSDFWHPDTFKLDKQRSGRTASIASPGSKSTWTPVLSTTLSLLDTSRNN